MLALLVASGCAATPAPPAPWQPPVQSAMPVPPPDSGPPSELRAAFERQLAAGWGWQNDKDDQVHAPLPDWRKWKRVRFWGIEHLMGFRYGSGHDALTVVLPVELPPGIETTTATCMSAFETWARPQARHYDVVLGPMRTKRGLWRGSRLLIKWGNGHVDFGFKRRKFSAAWAAYPAYAHGCLIYAVSMQWKDESALAQRVRDRFVEEGFERMKTLTELPPFRH